MECITGSLDISHISMPNKIIILKCPKCKKEGAALLENRIYYSAEKVNWIITKCEECGTNFQRKIDIISVIATLNIHDPEVT